MSIREKLKRKIMTLAGAPSLPTDDQLDQTLHDIFKILRVYNPKKTDWWVAAIRNLPGARTHKYPAEDYSDLNSLLINLLLQNESLSVVARETKD